MSVFLFVIIITTWKVFYKIKAGNNNRLLLSKYLNAY